MSEQKTYKEQQSNISLCSRQRMKIDGVKDAVSFNGEEVELITECGNAVVEGEGLRIKVLDPGTGIVELEGRVDSFYYVRESAPAEKRSGFFSGLFK